MEVWRAIPLRQRGKTLRQTCQCAVPSADMQHLQLEWKKIPLDGYDTVNEDIFVRNLFSAFSSDFGFD